MFGYELRSEVGTGQLTTSVSERTIQSVMTKILLLTLLCLTMLCMVPLMGSHYLDSGHLHHDASASCATCMGSPATSVVGFLFTLLGLSILIIPAAPLLQLDVEQFHPPRVR